MIWDTFTGAELWWLESWVRASQKQQVLWCVPNMHCLLTKSVPRKNNSWTGDRVMNGPFPQTESVTQIAEKGVAGYDRKDHVAWKNGIVKE